MTITKADTFANRLAMHVERGRGITLSRDDARIVAEMLEALERIVRNGTHFTMTDFDVAAARAAIQKAKSGQ